MTVIQLKVGKSNYNKCREVSVCLFGFEAYVSRTRGGVWTLGFCSDWNDWSFSKTYWNK